MNEPNKAQLGDGSDNYSQAAGQMAKVAKQMAANGMETTANAAAATVQASFESGKAAAEIAAGTATGGPWGAVISAAWALRHTLFKILICICLGLLFLVVLIGSLPTVLTNSVLGLDGTDVNPGTTIASSYDNLSTVITQIVTDGYNQSLNKVQQIIKDSGYDYDTSMEAVINYGQITAGYDIAYILAAYSVSMHQKNADVSDMKSKLESYREEMFPVTSQKKIKEVLIPATYESYREVSIMVITKKIPIGTINGITQYRYETAKKTYYLPDESKSTEGSITVPQFKPVTVSIPIYSGDTITGTKSEIYFAPNGTITLTPQKEKIPFIECIIHPFDKTIIEKAFNLDLNAQFDASGRTYEEVITNMGKALKMTLYGSFNSGQSVPLTDEEMIKFLNRQQCNETRKHILSTALSLVGKVPYFWGGKSEPGWNDEWNTPKLVTAAGSSTSGTIRPYGLDCSGFTDWVYNTALGVRIGAGTWEQYQNSIGITSDDLLPGDLGFLPKSHGGGWEHVLIFAGYGKHGERIWVHSSGGQGVILNTPSYESNLILRRPKNINYK